MKFKVLLNSSCFLEYKNPCRFFHFIKHKNLLFPKSVYCMYHMLQDKSASIPHVSNKNHRLWFSLFCLDVDVVCCFAPTRGDEKTYPFYTLRVHNQPVTLSSGMEHKHHKWKPKQLLTPDSKKEFRQNKNKMLFTQLIIVLLLLSTQQMLCQDYVDECPVENGFFADAVQCDRYYECKNGEVSHIFSFGLTHPT